MRLVSIKPVVVNGWVIQGSILDNDTICLILYNIDFDQAFVRYFDDEVRAHLYLTEMVFGDQIPSEE